MCVFSLPLFPNEGVPFNPHASLPLWRRADQDHVVTPDNHHPYLSGLRGGGYILSVLEDQVHMLIEAVELPPYGSPPFELDEHHFSKALFEYPIRYLGQPSTSAIGATLEFDALFLKLAAQ